jgi:hypothetical protein
MGRWRCGEGSRGHRCGAVIKDRSPCIGLDDRGSGRRRSIGAVLRSHPWLRRLKRSQSTRPYATSDEDPASNGWILGPHVEIRIHLRICQTRSAHQLPQRRSYSPWDFRRLTNPRQHFRWAVARYTTLYRIGTFSQTLVSKRRRVDRFDGTEHSCQYHCCTRTRRPLD